MRLFGGQSAVHSPNVHRGVQVQLSTEKSHRKTLLGGGELPAATSPWDGGGRLAPRPLPAAAGRRTPGKQDGRRRLSAGRFATPPAEGAPQVLPRVLEPSELGKTAMRFSVAGLMGVSRRGTGSTLPCPRDAPATPLHLPAWSRQAGGQGGT